MSWRNSQGVVWWNPTQPLSFFEITAWNSLPQEVEVLVVVDVGIRLREIPDLPSQDKDIPEAGTGRQNFDFDLSLIPQMAHDSAVSIATELLMTGSHFLQKNVGPTYHIFVAEYLHQTLTYFCSSLYQSPSIYSIYMYHYVSLCIIMYL